MTSGGPAFDWNLLRDGMTPRRGGVTFTRASTATYIHPTTGFITSAAINAARIEADGLLIEPQRTNTCTYSQDLTQSGVWGPQHITATANADVAPDGATTADAVLETNANSIHMFSRYLTATNGTVYTASAYLKKYTGTGRRWAYISLITGPSQGTVFLCLFDLQTGTCLDSRTVGSPASTACACESVGDYWRIQAGMAANHSGLYFFNFGLSNSATPSYDASLYLKYTGISGGAGMTMWQGQLEVGTYASSPIYVPDASSATRSADVCTLTIPAGVSSILITYGDNTTATVAVTPGGTYVLPASQKKYKSIVAL